MCKVNKLERSNKIRKLGRKIFKLPGPTLFNYTSKKLQNLKRICVDEFKMSLDEYLMTITDQPKVPGTTPAAMTSNSVASNSLIHWIPKITREAGWRRPGT